MSAVRSSREEFSRWINCQGRLASEVIGAQCLDDLENEAARLRAQCPPHMLSHFDSLVASRACFIKRMNLADAQAVRRGGEA